MTDAPAVKLRLGVSACLLGEAVRFDGGHKHDRFLTGTLGEHVEWVSVCPEVEVGLGTPRATLRLVDTEAGVAMLQPKTGADITADMRTYAAARVEQLATADLDGFVLKKGSPSCGLERVRVYPEQEGSPPRVDGRGLFTEALVERLPQLPVEEEGRLNDVHLREAFIDRVFAHRRWREFVAAEPSAGDLVAFHSRHKYTLLSHSPEHHKQMGRHVAHAGSQDASWVIEEYGRLFASAMAIAATRGKHTNVLQHLAGFLRDRLDDAYRQDLAAVIDDYRAGLVPLVVPVSLLRHHFRRHPHEWASGQTYLEPYPEELLLRNHV